MSGSDELAGDDDVPDTSKSKAELKAEALIRRQKRNLRKARERPLPGNTTRTASASTGSDHASAAALPACEMRRTPAWRCNMSLACRTSPYSFTMSQLR